MRSEACGVRGVWARQEKQGRGVRYGETLTLVGVGRLVVGSGAEGVGALWTEDGCGGGVGCGVWVRDVVGGNECEAKKQGGGCEV